MIFGFFVGVFVHFVSASETDFLQFKTSIFFYALLPPIIFDAGYNMKRTNFFKNISSILLYAIFGTIISTFVVGFGLYWLANLGAVNIDAGDVLDPLTFGALISSIDPIATLAILGNKQLKCDQLLYSLVFGESVLNDAVAITLYNTFRGFRSVTTGFTASDYFGAMGEFVVVSIVSLLLGAAFALVVAFVLRRVNFSKKPSNELILLLFSAYSCYAVAELLHMSGIMALFVCGVMMAHYAWYNVSSITRTTSRHTFHSFAHMAESFLFVYFGISSFFATQSKFNYEWSFSLIFWSVVLCVIGRALNIFPLSALANLGRHKKISFKMQIVMWFAGLRGAISFALALGMESPIPGAARFITTTMVIVVITTLGLGGSSTWLLGRMGMLGIEDVEEGPDPTRPAQGAAFVFAGADGTDMANAEHPRFTYVNQAGERPRTLSTITREGAGTAEARETNCLKRLNFHRIWTRFDAAYMQPWFGGRHAPRMVDYSAGHGDDGGDNTTMNNLYMPQAMHESRQRDEQEENAYLADGQIGVNVQRSDGSNLADLGALGPEGDGSGVYDAGLAAEAGYNAHISLPDGSHHVSGSGGDAGDGADGVGRNHLVGDDTVPSHDSR